MYKLICLDMDGTLLNSSGTVSNRNLKAVRLAHNKGIKVAVCTGRLFASARFYGDMLGVEVPVIASNGAYIREKDRNEVIYKAVLGYENLKRVYEILRKYTTTFFFHTFDTVFMERLEASSPYVKINDTLPKDKQIKIQVVNDWDKVFREYSDDILKCTAVAREDTEKIAAIKEQLQQLEGIEAVSSLSDNVEIMAKGVSKGRAVEVLAGYYGLNREEIICIGDNENDLSMLKYAGLGIAMGNGEDFVRDMADYVTETNNNDGVAKAIEKFVLQ